MINYRLKFYLRQVRASHVIYMEYTINKKRTIKSTGHTVTVKYWDAITLAYYFTKISRVILFWIAFILTRPFGATFGDLLTKPGAKGGLDYGTKGSSLILLGLLLVLIISEVVKLKQPSLKTGIAKKKQSE